MCKPPKAPKPLPPSAPVVFQPPPELQLGGEARTSAERRAQATGRSGRASLLTPKPGEAAALVRKLQERFLRPAGDGGLPEQVILTEQSKILEGQTPAQFAQLLRNEFRGKKGRFAKLPSTEPAGGASSLKASRQEVEKEFQKILSVRLRDAGFDPPRQVIPPPPPPSRLPDSPSTFF